eukprot:TRINITY_DN1816_c1_g1_i2.p1 TRINITY_DN1816_c1_g1~~TRINITY_DN1816_c1_g1_i2.p1  ORF type:complete len:127 (+),score=33.08 TRINITY_DN1816_c1_g1_i2:76-456(+)
MSKRDNTMPTNISSRKRARDENEDDILLEETRGDLQIKRLHISPPSFFPPPSFQFQSSSATATTNHHSQQPSNEQQINPNIQEQQQHVLHPDLATSRYKDNNTLLYHLHLERMNRLGLPVRRGEET